jgi:hypothetical protein
MVRRSRRAVDPTSRPSRTLNGTVRDRGTNVLKKRSELLWKALTLVGGAAIAAVATRLLAMVWRKATDTETPLEREPGATTRSREIVWVISSGITIALVRLVARRAMARAWRATTGHYPQQLTEAPGTPVS